MQNKPILGISMGDPSGIGPEITVKALSHREVYAQCRPLVTGDLGILRAAAKFAGVRQEFNGIREVKDARFEYGVIDVIDLQNVEMSKHEYGKASAMSGNAAFEAVTKCIELAMAREIDATVTGPINKEAIHLAGHLFAGHTEIYAHYTGTREYTMLLAHDNLRVVHVSTHVSLAEACALVKKDRVLNVIRLAHNACVQLGIQHPRIGVAGLNPHAGENGLFGREEIDEIIPAIELAREAGLAADGPIPPDTLFSKARGGWYDIAVAMYHDQGHIALKMVGFVWNEERKNWDSVSGVNITLGLPIIRSSVDHGTAFDRAGKGISSETSLLNAIEYGTLLAINRRSNQQ